MHRGRCAPVRAAEGVGSVSLAADRIRRVQFADVVAGFTFHDPAQPVYANVTGRRIASGAEAKRLCVEQIVSSVQWVTEIHSLLADGFSRFLETGPGKVLTGLMRAFDGDASCTPVGTMEQAAAAAGAD